METRVVNTIPEWRYQAAVIARLHDTEDRGLPFTCAGDMNRAEWGSREASLFKACCRRPDQLPSAADPVPPVSILGRLRPHSLALLIPALRGLIVVK
ncbi:hypothetical protein DB459_21095 [Bradyrhizobium sp. WD16]|nr:hypothetical protein DB459_21095 [Bradyrhizobium sp. WD16]